MASIRRAARSIGPGPKVADLTGLESHFRGQLAKQWPSELRIGHLRPYTNVDSHVRLHLLVRRPGRLRSVSRRPYPVCLTKRFISYDNSPAAGRNDPGFRGSGRQRRHGS